MDPARVQCDVPDGDGTGFEPEPREKSMSVRKVALASLFIVVVSLTGARAAEPRLAVHLPTGATLVGGFDPARLPAGSAFDPLTWRETPILRHAQEALDLLRAAGVDPVADVDTLAFGVFGESAPDGLSVVMPPLVVVAFGRLDPAAMEAAAPPGVSCREVAPATVLLGLDALAGAPAAGREGPEIPADAALWLAAGASALSETVHSAGSLLFRDLGLSVAHVSVSAGVATVELQAQAGSDTAAAERAAWTNSLLDLLRPLAVGRTGLEAAAGVEITSLDDSLIARLVLNEVQLTELAETLRPFRAGPILAGPGHDLTPPERIGDEPAAAGTARGDRRRAGRR